MALRPLICLALATLVACGGRYRVGDDEATAGGSGGSAASGGTKSTTAGEPARCVEQRSSYLDYRAQVIDDQVAVAEPCRSSDQCGLFFDTTGCGTTCGVAIPSSARRGIDDRLYAFTEMNCDPECHVEPPQNCMQRPAAVCIEGVCQ